MRFLQISTIAVAFLVCGCRKSADGVPFLSSAESPSGELLNVGKSTATYLRSRPWDFTTVWTNGSACRVFLSCGHGERWGEETWIVLLIGSEQEVLDYNYLHAKEHCLPRGLLSVSPLRIGFGPPDSKQTSQIAEAHFPVEGWQDRLNRDEEMLRNLQSIRNSRTN
jgi:hypothetical protein